ncbi:Dynamin-like GTPase that mediates homotypic ER fusion [Tulasnella sp. JGI-2019a]|nr:Dynamin-like GTPase that mediates homotypic ER fusion [Tulasnella sp. JGI-2019a]KAG8999853.1 Dynamin-like GTPase that mediates homotypic ER fusion [Tulasnella sp. JGI-2019a]
MPSAPTTSHSPQRVIDRDQNFTADFNNSLKTWGLLNVGFNYNVVSIFGSQSTGKSTLLNSLFDTTFDVMAKTRREQTTRGLWMSRAKDVPIVIMDVEGVDSREQGEDQDFQRKAALFALASTEVLIVNLWEDQVGLHNGANMGLLKTVFEVNLSLFGNNSSQSRTLLLFVIRDRVSATPLSNLQATLVADLTNIWRVINKPEGQKQCRLDDYFDMSFVQMAHKLLSPDQFDTDVVELRKRFTDGSREDCVFKPEYHKRIPTDGMANYMESVWDLVRHNHDLNLPTQHELLAQFRCDQIAACALEAFEMQSRPFRRPNQGGQIVDELGTKMRSWKNTAITYFDTSASRYQQSVYARTREGLVTRLNTSLFPLYLSQLTNLRLHALAELNRKLEDRVRGRNDYNGGALLAQARQESKFLFETKARECTGLGPLGTTEEGSQPIDPGWTYQAEFNQLKQEMGVVADRFKKEETEKLLRITENKFKTQIATPVKAILVSATSDMWDRVLRVFKRKLVACETTFQTKIGTFNSTEDENRESIYILRKQAWLGLRNTIEEETSDISFQQKLWDCFETQFQYDEKGILRSWTSKHDLDAAFGAAKKKALRLLQTYSRIHPNDASMDYTLQNPPATLSALEEGFDFIDTKTIFSEERKKVIADEFCRHADALYLQTKRIVDKYIPGWMGTAAAVGFGAGVMVMPLSTICLYGVGFVAHKLGLTRPLIQMMREVHRRISQCMRALLSSAMRHMTSELSPVTGLMRIFWRSISAKMKSVEGEELGMNALSGGSASCTPPPLL